MPIDITPLTDPSSGRLVWLASRPTGTPVGAASLRLFTGGQRHLAELQLNVHPAERRRQVGSRLLAAAAGAARDDGRRSLIAQADADSAGAEFLPRRGFRRVLTLIYARLALADADAAALTGIVERPQPGYRTVSWEGEVSDDLAAAYAESRRAMDDMPMGDTDYGTVTWDVERLRAAARAVAARGDVLRTFAAVHEADGSIAGFTELVAPGDGKGDGQHYGTAIVPEHRGHGLGRALKAASILHAVRAGLDGLLTDTASDNAPMRAINDELGYVPTHSTFQFQLDLRTGSPA